MWVWTGRIISRRGGRWWGWGNEDEKNAVVCMVFHVGIIGVDKVQAGAAVVETVEKLENRLYN